MRTFILGLLAIAMITGTIACFWSSDEAISESDSTPDINATISAAVAKAVAEETERKQKESATPSQTVITSASTNGQTNWLDSLSQFRRVKVARDEVACVGYEYGRYSGISHAIIRVDDGYYALGNPGDAVAFYDDNSGCRIGVITDESLE